MSNENQLNEQMHEAQAAVSYMMGDMLPPMPQPRQRVGIYIDIDNDNVENSDANCTGSVSDLSAALMMAVSINDKLLMPVIIAAAALTADKPELRKKYDDLVVYFSKTPQHG